MLTQSRLVRWVVLLAVVMLAAAGCTEKRRGGGGGGGGGSEGEGEGDEGEGEGDEGEGEGAMEGEGEGTEGEGEGGKEGEGEGDEGEGEGTEGEGEGQTEGEGEGSTEMSCPMMCSYASECPGLVADGDCVAQCELMRTAVPELFDCIVEAFLDEDCNAARACLATEGEGEASEGEGECEPGEIELCECNSPETITHTCDRTGHWEDCVCPPPCADQDGDRYGQGEGCLGTDCNDRDANINRGHAEVCDNAKDDDCDGQTDEGCELPCTDRDGDRYGNGEGCLGTDCNDNNRNIYPGHAETCNNALDDDCDGQTDEGCAGDPPCTAFRTCQNNCIETTCAAQCDAWDEECQSCFYPCQESCWQRTTQACRTCVNNSNTECYSNWCPSIANLMTCRSQQNCDDQEWFIDGECTQQQCAAQLEAFITCYQTNGAEIQANFEAVCTDILGVCYPPE